MEPIIYVCFGVFVLLAVILVALAVHMQRQKKKDAAKIHKVLSDTGIHSEHKEYTTQHLADKTGIPLFRVHLAVDRLEETHGVRSRYASGGPIRDYREVRYVSTPVVIVDSGPSLTDVVLAEELLSHSYNPPAAEAPTFSGYGGGSSGGAGASDSWSSSDSSSSSSSSGDGGSCGDGGGGTGGGDGG